MNRTHTVENMRKAVLDLDQVCPVACLFVWAVADAHSSEKSSL